MNHLHVKVCETAAKLKHLELLGLSQTQPTLTKVERKISFRRVVFHYTSSSADGAPKQ